MQRYKNGRRGIMARPKKKNYDPDAVMKELIDTVTSIYVSVEAHPSLQTIADELNLNSMKYGSS